MQEFEDATESADPIVSIVIPARGDLGELGRRTLRSISAQTIAPSRLEVIAVGPQAEIDVWADLALQHESLTIRLLASDAECDGTFLGRGLRAARGQRLFIMEPGDVMAPELLAVLARHAQPGILPVAHVAELQSRNGQSEAPYFGTSLSRALLRRAGSTVPLTEIAEIFETLGGKLIPTRVARQLDVASSQPISAAIDFWFRLASRVPLQAFIPSMDGHPVYYTAGSRSGSHEGAPELAPVIRCIDVLCGVEPYLDSTVTGEAARNLWEIHGVRINAFLQNRPEKHQAVVDETRARGLRRWPFEWINRGLARDLAILYCALPHVDTSALVAARRIRSRRVLVDVVGQDLQKLRPSDPTSMVISSEFVERTATTSAAPTFGGWPGIRGFCRQAAEAISNLEKEKGPYRSVYSRSMWPASHIMAALYKTRNRETPWLAEFSDPMLKNIRGEKRSEKLEDDWVTQELAGGLRAVGAPLPTSMLLFEWVEVLAYALADELLFTNPLQRDYMLSYCSNRSLADRARAKSTVEPHPTLPSEYYSFEQCPYPLDESRIHVAYFGVLYATRGLTEVIEAVRALDTETRHLLRIHVFTSKPDEVQADMRRHELGDVIVARQYVPYLQFLNLTTRFDVLMVNDAATKAHHPVNPYLPSKWSDYSGSGRPIWAIVEPGSMLSGFETKYTSELGNVSSARKVLEQLVADGSRERTQPAIHAGLDSKS